VHDFPFSIPERQENLICIFLRYTLKNEMIFVGLLRRLNDCALAAFFPGARHKISFIFQKSLYLPDITAINFCFHRRLFCAHQSFKSLKHENSFDTLRRTISYREGFCIVLFHQKGRIS